MDLLKRLGATAEEIRITSGGAKSPFWIQMLADMFDSPCVTLECDEGPAYGAAILAGVGIGIWPDVATACEQTIKIRSRVMPSGVDYSVKFGRYQKLYSQTSGWNVV